MSQTTHQTSKPFYIGIDFHKHYSVFCVINDRNTILGNWGSVFIFIQNPPENKATPSDKTNTPNL